MVTLPYRDYRKEQFDEEVVLTTPRHGSGSWSKAGLSSFHLPISVNIEVSHPSNVTFRFGYPNDEPPERVAHALPGDEEVSLLLGRHTRKVLEVRFSSALERITKDALSFDPDRTFGWCRALDSYRQFVFRRNAETISRILNTIPAPLVRQIRKALTEMAA